MRRDDWPTLRATLPLEHQSEPEKTQQTLDATQSSFPSRATRRDSYRIPCRDHEAQVIGLRGLDDFGRILACARLRQWRGQPRLLIAGMRRVVSRPRRG